MRCGRDPRLRTTNDAQESPKIEHEPQNLNAQCPCSTAGSPPCWKTCISADCSMRPWWSRWENLAARPRSVRSPAAPGPTRGAPTTGRTVTPSSSPAAGYPLARSCVQTTPMPPTPRASRSRSPTSPSPSIAPLASTLLRRSVTRSTNRTSSAWGHRFAALVG